MLDNPSPAVGLILEQTGNCWPMEEKKKKNTHENHPKCLVVTAAQYQGTSTKMHHTRAWKALVKNTPENIC